MRKPLKATPWMVALGALLTGCARVAPAVAVVASVVLLGLVVIGTAGQARRRRIR